MSAPSEPTFGLLYTMCNPAPAQRTFETFYREVLEQVRWAEDLGMETVWVAEHHFDEDNYASSPLLLLAAIAAQTRGMRLGTALMVPALHQPIRLAEEIATLSVISDGRFDVGLGLGYRPQEFAAFGHSIKNRVSLLEDLVEMLRRALRGESLRFDARRLSFPDVSITPVPERMPRILIGAETEASIERVARIGDGLLAGGQAEQGDHYLRALEEQGRDPSEAYVSMVQRMIVAEDPEAAWARIGECALRTMNGYVRSGLLPEGTHFEDADSLLAAGWFTLMDASMAVDHLVDLLHDRPHVRDVRMLTMLPGEDVESSSERLEYYATQVVPQVRRDLAAHRS